MGPGVLVEGAIKRTGLIGSALTSLSVGLVLPLACRSAVIFSDDLSDLELDDLDAGNS